VFDAVPKTFRVVPGNETARAGACGKAPAALRQGAFLLRQPFRKPGKFRVEFCKLFGDVVEGFPRLAMLVTLNDATRNWSYRRRAVRPIAGDSSCAVHPQT
jgi:hypothetical protein